MITKTIDKKGESRDEEILENSLQSIEFFTGKKQKKE